MADLKLSDLLAATTLAEDTYFYGIQNGVSKKIGSNVILSNIQDPILKGRIVFEGVQLIKGSDRNQTISMTKSRTEFSVGPLTVFPNLPNAPVDGFVKIITLANVSGGQVRLTTANSNIYPNVSVVFKNQGESLMMIYSSNSYANGWVILGSTPGLETSLILPEANISDQRIRRAISAKDGTINYDEANGTIQVGDLSNIVTTVSLANVTTDNLREGNINLYFTNSRAIYALTPDLNRLRKPNANVIYVAMNGDDALDGLTMANAIANIHTAMNRVNAYWTVKVFPGQFTLYNQPVTIPRKVSLIGNDLRTCDIIPAEPTVDMFYINNGAYVNGFTFRGHRAANPNRVKEGAAVFSYNPNGSAGNITTSPYIQNCSSITTTGTGIRVDGRYVGGLRSMVLDAFTQFNQGGIGIHLLNSGYMQLVSLFTINCEYSVLCESGGFGSITNSNSSFGTYGLVADGVSPTLYSGTVVRQLTSRTIEMISPNGKKPNIQDKVLMANYRQDKCFRDTGLIVDSLALDLAYSGNTQSRFAGLQYSSQGLSRIADQKTEVLNTWNYIKTIASNVVLNATAWDDGPSKPYQGTNTQVILGAAPGSGYAANLVANVFDQFIDIYTNGVFGVTDKIVPNKFPSNTNVDIQRTANLLIANKSFIQSEASAFLSTNYPYASYIPGRTIGRDAGKLIDSIVFDILHDGNRQTLTFGTLFFDYLQDVSTIANQVPQTSAAFRYIKTIIGSVLTNTAVANVYQTVYTQNTSISANVSANIISYVRDRVDDITDIIDNGPTYQGVQYNIEPISLTQPTDPNVITATRIILANRDFIRAEVLEYVNQNWMDISNGTRNFYTVGEAGNVDPSSNLVIVSFDEKILAVDRPLANTRTSFHQGSYLSASSHTFEYVGSGNELLSSLPYNGGVPVQAHEVVETRGGAVYYTSTDHKGDFRIGNELLINRADGTINGRTFNKSLFAVMTPYILALQ